MSKEIIKKVPKELLKDFVIKNLISKNKLNDDLNLNIALTGDLGSGKTTLTKTLGEILNIKENITSPTFTILNEYKSGKVNLYHLDLYRIKSLEELNMTFDIDEIFLSKGIKVIEWPELIEDLLPRNIIRINIEYTKNENERIIKIKQRFS